MYKIIKKNKIRIYILGFDLEIKKIFVILNLILVWGRKLNRLWWRDGGFKLFFLIMYILLFLLNINIWKIR